MSSGQLSRLSGMKISSRLFSQVTVRLQEQSSGRPLIPEALKLRIEKSKQRLVIPTTISNDNLKQNEYERLRVVPALKTFFGGNPVHEENMNHLNSILRKHINLPTRSISDEELRRKRFISFEAYKESIQSGTRFKDIHHKELLHVLNRLRSIDVELTPKDVTQALAKYWVKSDIATSVTAKVKTLDEFGRAHGKAKRKVSQAEVYLSKGDGEAIINGKPLIEYFTKDTDRKKIAYPFQVISQEAQYNIFATVNGGGVTGQTEAVMYAIAKALIVFNPLLKPRLSKAGLVTSDARNVERKKPGKVKARKSPTWVKR
ncbi:mitochondrial ribosomal protein S9 [Scheffersomyces coipomensis]|uniref:mitochondrial ribosomal protein S9 n=1 Tax=Scheffersomyces coipomensis TaxID=1788519 RepID=UPI00315C4EAF